MMSVGDPVDPGSEMPDLNLFEPGIMPEGAPAPVAQAPAANPMSGMMYASMGISAIGAILNAVSQSSAQKAQGEYEATIANTNAEIAGVQERQALELGSVEASRQNLKTEQVVGAQKASQGASGVDVNSGSGAAVRAETSGVGAIDELTIRNNAARQAWGYRVQALQDTYQGKFAKLTAKSESTQSLISGGLSAIEGPLAIESNYLRFSRYMGVGGSAEVNRGNTAPPFPNMN